MMGRHARSESLFYYFRLEDQVPEDHLLRLIDKHVDFGFVHQRVEASYSDIGRPSIDPELLLRIVLIGYLYGISSERKLIEELRMHLAWRWFTGLGFDEEVPHHSTFSKNRHGRLQESKLFEQLFERIVTRCMEVGLVRGDNSWPKPHRSIEQFASTSLNWKKQNPVEEPTQSGQGIHHRSRFNVCDQRRYARTHGVLQQLPVDNHSCIVVGVQATGARLSEESRAAREMTARFAQWQGRKPESIAANASYGNGEFLQWLVDREITPYMPTRDAVGRTRSPFYGPERFTYLPESNSYICPAGQQLNYGGRNERNRTFGYIGTRKKCGPCLQRSQCTTGPFRYLAIHMNEAARQRARDLWTTPEFEYAQRQRKKVEALFAELKCRIGLHHLRLRRLKFVQEQFFLAATAQNIKRLVRFLTYRQYSRFMPPFEYGR